MTELWELGVNECARAVRTGTSSPLAIVESLLERSERLDHDIQAWARLTPERALDEARALSQEAKEGRFRGPLHGVPVAIKDNFDTAGIETNVGSQLLRGRIPSDDAAAVARLRAAGAIVLGKTAMTVFAAMDPAPTRNPWNLAHTPGGSSSGSAAAVAAMLVPAAIGSQTAGSIIRPAAYCGVVGLKPTYGAIDRAGLYPCAWSMDHVGPLARSVADAALMFEAMTQQATQQGETSVRGLRIGVPTGWVTSMCTGDTLQAFERAMHALARAGASISSIDLPATFVAGVDAGIITMYAEMAAVHAERYPAERERYSWRLACLIDAGRAVSATDYLRAQQVRRAACADLSALLTRVDCLATPSTPAPAPRGLDATGDWRCNLPFSSLGNPVLTVPVALTADGMPIGVQLVGAYRGESTLFRIGSALEQQVAFPSSPFRNR